MRAYSILTDQQARVLRFIEDFRKARQYPPTRAEIAKHFGWASANAAEEHLRALEYKGKIRLERGVSRGIFVL